ncbi:MAG: hypothetical protein R3Y10_02490 [Ferrimonas sp.]
MLQLVLFLAAALIIGLAPVYVGARLLRTGSPSMIAAIIAIAAFLALQDLSFRYIAEPNWAWISSLLSGAIAISLMLDCAYWKALFVTGFIILIQLLATDILLNGIPAPEYLSELLSQTQQQLWPSYKK